MQGKDALPTTLRAVLANDAEARNRYADNLEMGDTSKVEALWENLFPMVPEPQLLAVRPHLRAVATTMRTGSTKA